MRVAGVAQGRGVGVACVASEGSLVWHVSREGSRGCLCGKCQVSSEGSSTVPTVIGIELSLGVEDPTFIHVPGKFSKVRIK